MYRRAQEGSAASVNGAATFTFPDPPASSMGIIPHHAKIAREALAKEYPLMRLAPLAIAPGNYSLHHRSCRRDSVVEVSSKRTTLYALCHETDVASHIRICWDIEPTIHNFMSPCLPLLLVKHRVSCAYRAQALQEASAQLPAGARQA